MKNEISEDKLKELRELEYIKSGSHTDAMYKKASHNKRKELIINLIKQTNSSPNSVILDYGCAEGIYCKEYLDLGFENVFGTDIADLKLKKAKERKTGARGLRSIMESVLLDTMYNIPSQDGVTKVVIDEAVINGESEPLLMYETGDSGQEKTASSDPT